MSLQAQAAVAIEPHRVRFQNVTVPDPGPDDVVVRVTHSWISNGTEGSFVRGERIAGDTPRGESDPLPFPHVPGYQKVGVVERVGKNVNSVSVGETVFNTLSAVEEMFFSYAGHISPAVSHQSQIWKLPTHLNPVAASGLVLTQVGYNVGIRGEIKPGDAAVVIGDGMVGHWAAQTLQFRGARVLMLGRHQSRLDLLDILPGDKVLGAGRNDSLQSTSDAVKAWAPEGVQLVADTVGSIDSVEALYPALRHGGHLVSAGFYGPNGSIDIQKMRDRELTLHAPAGWSTERMNQTLHLLSRGVLKTEHLITHRFPVAQASEAFDLILSRSEPFLGVVLDW
jgi:2-desacetyl-2-hydroxyethyl bacteriochlorophyllide A dehydrogenase